MTKSRVSSRLRGQGTRGLLYRLQSSLRTAFRAHARGAGVWRARAGLSVPHVLRQRHRAAGAQFSLARPGLGVLPDLGSHLLDTALFWFGGQLLRRFRSTQRRPFENCAFDHVVLRFDGPVLFCKFEMTLLELAQSFLRCDVLAEHGSAHIHSLCKWGPTRFTHAPARTAERPPCRRHGHAGSERSDLGARICRLQTPM